VLCNVETPRIKHCRTAGSEDAADRQLPTAPSHGTGTTCGGSWRVRDLTTNQHRPPAPERRRAAETRYPNRSDLEPVQRNKTARIGGLYNEYSLLTCVDKVFGTSTKNLLTNPRYSREPRFRAPQQDQATAVPRGHLNKYEARRKSPGHVRAESRIPTGILTGLGDSPSEPVDLDHADAVKGRHTQQCIPSGTAQPSNNQTLLHTLRSLTQWVESETRGALGSVDRRAKAGGEG